MNYILVKADSSHIDKLIKYKLASILDYAHNLDEKEKKRIINYVKVNIPQCITEYMVIEIDKKVVGCLHTTKHEDGILLDEIYIEKEYQNHGLGTHLIKNLIQVEKRIYLWVYKENKIAYSLYKKLGFKVIDETESRYYMQYKGE